MTWALKHIAHRDPIRIQTRSQEELLQKCKCSHTKPLLPELRWQSLTWNCDSLSLGMSFHVARKTWRSADGETHKVHIKSRSWDNGKVLIKTLQNVAAMWKTQSCKCKFGRWGGGAPFFWIKGAHQGDRRAGFVFGCLIKSKLRPDESFQQNGDDLLVL